MIEIKALIKFLYERKLKALEKEKFAKSQARAAITNQIQLIDELLVFLSKQQGELNMEDLDLFLDEKIQPLGEMTQSRELSKVTQLLMQKANSLPPKSKVQLNPKALAPTTASTKVSILRRKGLIPKDVTTSAPKGELWLIRK